jgi:hypothetical protein
MTSQRVLEPAPHDAGAPDRSPTDGTVYIGDRPPIHRRERELREYGILVIAAIVIAAALVLFAQMPVPYAAGVLPALAYLLLCVRRPVWGCAVLVLATPLIEGLGRGTVIPFLRPSEAMLALLVVGVLVHEIPRRQRRNFVAMDLAVLAYALGVVLIPVLYLLFTRGSGDLAAWLNIFSPLQYLAVYLLFSRLGTTDRERRLFLNLALAGSVVVSLVGMAQLVNVPGLQGFLDAHYPIEGDGASLCSYGVCRPSSVMQHYSAFGAYSLLNYTIAVGLLAGRHVFGFDRRWLVFVLAVDGMGVFVSETVAVVVGLVLATAIVLVHHRTFPKQLLYVGVALVIGIAFFWSDISSRVAQQFPAGSQSVAGVPMPESMEVRQQYWGQFFWPELQPVIWTGSGNAVPDVPASLQNYVDNEYLGMGFRAGVVGEILLVVMLAAVAVTAWRAKRSKDPLEAAVGSMAVAFVVVLAVIGTTAEYLLFAGFAQVLWMVIGMLAGFRVPARAGPDSPPD